MAGKWLLRRGSRFFAKSSRRRILAVNDLQSLPISFVVLPSERDQRAPIAAL